jgi:hypothetical protein
MERKRERERERVREREREKGRERGRGRGNARTVRVPCECGQELYQVFASLVQGGAHRSLAQAPVRVFVQLVRNQHAAQERYRRADHVVAPAATHAVREPARGITYASRAKGRTQPNR